MKLDVNVLRYLSKDDFRTLTAVEMGQKNHEIVPAQLVDSIAGLKHGGTFKCLRTLLRHKLVHHDGSKYDGYRLTTLGYDFLAIRALVARGAIAGVGRQIGVGKESDVFEVTDDEGRVMALKLHRLGRTSFRAVKSKRDYVRRGNHVSWLYLSRLAALKEFAFMKALGDAGLPVPEAIECNRHAVLMSLIHAYPMVQVKKLLNPRKVYSNCMDVLVRLLQLGLVHCDYNEFNLLIDDNEQLTLIDFPQMVSAAHPNARELFDRDVEGVVKFFERKLGYLPEDDPALELVAPKFDDALRECDGSLDAELRASGWRKDHEQALDRWVTAGRTRREETEDTSSDGSEDSDDDLSQSSGSEEDDSEDDNETESTSHEEEEQEILGMESGGEDICNIEHIEENQAAEDAVEASDDLSEAVSKGMRLRSEEVASRVADERRRNARRKAIAKASRNATKSKNKGKKKGAENWKGGGIW